MTPRSFFAPTLLYAALALTMTGAVHAQTAPEPDTQVLSDSLTYDDANKVSIFNGNVVLTRGPMTLRADTLRLREDAQGNQLGSATASPGKLVFVRQEDPEKFQVIEAQGTRAEYNGQTEEIEMIGQAVVTRLICGKPFDTISGARVTYRQKSDTYEAHGGQQSAAPGGRVRSIAQPRAKTDAAIAECRRASAR